ncbi:MAG: acylphosphatase [Kiritimatiellae bacterium]|nr:acylphosphatase [Kiritimatiellia bacterium]
MGRLHIHVFGRVQGVGFRYACCREARALRLTGWVRNRPDGSVEIVAEGSPAALKTFEDWCRQGPSWADVERVTVTPEPTRGEYLSFEIG